MFDYIKSYKPVLLSSSRRKASVACIFYEKDSETHILFTKRHATMKEHAGEISFPGGRFETADETLLKTAMRETSEEIDVQLNEDHLIGQIDDLYTTSKYLVSPYVFQVDQELNFNINGEIDKLVEVPLKHLLDDKNYRSEQLFYKQRYHKIHYYNYQDEVIWGATGAMLNSILSLLSR